MFKVLNKQIIAPNVKRLDILAADLANQIQPGQFVMVELKKMPGVKRAYSLSSSPTPTPFSSPLSALSSPQASQ